MSQQEHKPFVPPESTIAEFTFKSVVLGVIMGIIFGAVTVYLALSAGLTVSASIPIAVLAIAVFKKLGGSTILENNMVQTIGSSGEAVAAGVVFTVPAFLFIAGGKDFFNLLQISTIAAVGGAIGVLMMVPLRKALIVKEHGALPYPEGTACADVLIAGERKGEMAKTVFSGFWTAMLFTALMRGLGLFKTSATWFSTQASAAFPNASLASAIKAEYLGVGYIIGPRIAGIMVSGSVLTWLVIIPLLSLFVTPEAVDADLLDPVKMKGRFTPEQVEGMSNPTKFYHAYARLIGAGAVAMAGLMTLIRTLPVIFSSMRDSIRDLRNSQQGGGSILRTNRDMPFTWLIGGCIALVLIMAFLPNLPTGEFPGNLLMAILMLVFGFIFVAVSSRICGLIGSSSNPVSGMTIATLLGTCLIFLSLGMGGDMYQGTALCVGAIVCTAAANAGATSQDLKTGFLVGGTPVKQQIGELIGVLLPAAAIGFTLMLMHNSEMGPIGSPELSAPQGTLMATLIQGVLSQDLNWGFIFVGCGLAIMAQLCGINPLAWAVGAYLPIATTFTIFIGGSMRWMADRIRGEKEESEITSGTLFSTGLVAGGAIATLLIIIIVEIAKKAQGPEHFMKAMFDWGQGLMTGAGLFTDWFAIAALGVLSLVLVRKALKKLDI